MKNAIRDGAYWSWVPYGSETCAFCITLASQGYVKASKKVLQGNHATHIHENCKCEFVITFGNAGIAGFDPQKYSDMYYSHGGDINKMRRDLDAQNREKINAQKREAYARRKNNQLLSLSITNLYDEYGGKSEDWQHVKAKGNLNTSDGDRDAEIHWVKCEGIGKKEMFVKRWLDES